MVNYYLTSHRLTGALFQAKGLISAMKLRYKIKQLTEYVDKHGA